VRMTSLNEEILTEMSSSLSAMNAYRDAEVVIPLLNKFVSKYLAWSPMFNQIVSSEALSNLNLSISSLANRPTASCDDLGVLTALVCLANRVTELGPNDQALAAILLRENGGTHHNGMLTIYPKGYIPDKDLETGMDIATGLFSNHASAVDFAIRNHPAFRTGGFNSEVRKLMHLQSGRWPWWAQIILYMVRMDVARMRYSWMRGAWSTRQVTNSTKSIDSRTPYILLGQPGVRGLELSASAVEKLLHIGAETLTLLGLPTASELAINGPDLNLPYSLLPKQDIPALYTSDLLAGVSTTQPLRSEQEQRMLDGRLEPEYQRTSGGTNKWVGVISQMRTGTRGLIENLVTVDENRIDALMRGSTAPTIEIGLYGAVDIHSFRRNSHKLN